MKKKLKVILIIAIVLVAAVFLTGAILRTTSTGFMLYEAGLSPFGYEVFEREEVRNQEISGFVCTDGAPSGSYSLNNYEYMIIRTENEDTKAPVLSFFIRPIDPPGRWVEAINVQTEEKPYLAFTWEDIHRVREDNTLLKKYHYVCYGKNAIGTIAFQDSQLPDGTVINIQQREEDFWIHLIFYGEKDENFEFPNVQELLLENGCIA